MQPLIFADPKSRALVEQIERVARSDAAVLISGETGTGKELVARHVHAHSGRRGAFVAVNCGALSQSLAEAELFGHQSGAFTGATEARAGWFETANGGTLFLDEIGDLPLAIQVKLLRVLQEREVVRVGARRPIALDVRLITATNVDLVQALVARRFRMDLYYRLNVATFDLPPLRARPGDILPLANHFLRLYSDRLELDAPVLLPETKEALLNYSWPGNIRALENVIHFALLTATDNVIRPENLRFIATSPAAAAMDIGHHHTPIESIASQLDRLFAARPPQLYQTFEELIVRRAFAHCGHNQLRTARLLGISRNILRTQLKRFGFIAKESPPNSTPGRPGGAADFLSRTSGETSNAGAMPLISSHAAVFPKR